MTTDDSAGPTVPPVQDRRRHCAPDGSPMAVLANMPALTLLSRLLTPMLAVADGGAIVYANDAFAAMLGHEPEVVSTLTAHELFEDVERVETAGVAIEGDAEILVRLLHADGGVIKAVMSGSLLLRSDDPVALVTFQDVTDLLWLQGR